VGVDIGDFGFRDLGLLALLLWRLLAIRRRPALPFLLGPRDRLPKCFNITDWQNGRASLRLHGIHRSHRRNENTIKSHII